MVEFCQESGMTESNPTFRYKGKRLLLCKRQMEEVGGEPSHRRWSARCFEVQVQEPGREHMKFLAAETADLTNAHQEASRRAKEQAELAAQWEQDANDGV